MEEGLKRGRGLEIKDLVRVLVVFVRFVKEGGGDGVIVPANLVRAIRVVGYREAHDAAVCLAVFWEEERDVLAIMAIRLRGIRHIGAPKLLVGKLGEVRELQWPSWWLRPGAGYSDGLESGGSGDNANRCATALRLRSHHSADLLERVAAREDRRRSKLAKLGNISADRRVVVLVPHHVVVIRQDVDNPRLGPVVLALLNAEQR